MQIKAITVNAADTAVAGHGIQGNGALDANQAQTENSNVFGPEYKVTISREGKLLSRRQTAREEEGTRNGENVREERKQLHQQEQAELAKEIRDGYREELAAIEKQISDYNRSYGRIDIQKVAHDKGLMSKTIEEEEKLRTAIQSQKDIQAEENQRRAREAQQLAMQSAQYQQEVDENNRDLLTLLKTMEETEKAEEEAGEAAEKADGSGASGLDSSAGDAIKGSAAQFVAASIGREMGVQERMADLEESGRWYIDTADSIARSALQKSAGIRAAMDDGSFSDEQIAEMMQDLRADMAGIYDDVKDFREFGIQVLGNVREAGIEHIAANPLKGMQETKNSMMQSALDAGLGEARQGVLDKSSQELADEVKELIDERNDVDRIPQDKEEAMEEDMEKEVGEQFAETEGEEQT